MTRLTMNISDRQARNVHKVVDSHISALKNRVASAVESGEFQKAQQLAKELCEYEVLFFAFNIVVEFEIAELGGKPVETEIFVDERRR